MFSGDLRHIDVANALGLKPETAGFVTVDTKEDAELFQDHLADGYH